MQTSRSAAAALPGHGGRAQVPWRGIVPPEPRETTEPMLEWSLGAGHVAAIIALVLVAARVLAWVG